MAACSLWFYSELSSTLIRHSPPLGVQSEGLQIDGMNYWCSDLFTFALHISEWTSGTEECLMDRWGACGQKGYVIPTFRQTRRPTNVWDSLPCSSECAE